jgi:hypothetical protein
MTDLFQTARSTASQVTGHEQVNVTPAIKLQKYNCEQVTSVCILLLNYKKYNYKQVTRVHPANKLQQI